MKTNKWVLDPTHSELQFKVKHLMISTVTGQFKEFKSVIETSGTDISTARIEFTADVNSVTTNNEDRDKHLRTGDFFDAGKYPTISFISSQLKHVKDDHYKLSGKLTMRGVTKDEELDVEFGGITTDPWGNQRSGFSLTGKINRQDYGVSFGMVSETGGLLLADEVRILAEVQFVMQNELQEA